MARVLICALLVLCAPATARADETVTFDDLTVGTQVTNQYADLGGTGQGVVFGPLPGNGAVLSSLRPVVFLTLTAARRTSARAVTVPRR